MISLTKKLLSVALAVVLLLGAFPATVFAAEAEDPTDAVVEVTPDAPASVDPSTPSEPKPEPKPEPETDPKPEPKPEATNKYIITFDANHKGVSDPKAQVYKGTGKLYFKNLPTVTAKGEEMIGWYAPNGNLVRNGDEVTDDMTLTAHWTAQKFDVTFVDVNGKAIKNLKVAYGEKLSTDDIPDLSLAGNKNGMTPYKWLADNGADTDVAVKKDLTFKPQYKSKTFTLTLDPNSDKLKEEYKQCVYGEEIGPMKQPSLTDKVFMGYYKDGQKYTSKDEYLWNSDVTLKAHWEDEALIELHIYRNGKTSSAYTEPMVPNVPVNTTFDLSNIDIRDYYKASDSFKVEGIFDSEGWRAFKAGDNAKPITQIRTIPREKGIVELYVMITDTNAPKPTTKPADPSNPQTGDNSMILATTTAMLISAGALVMFVYDRKRRNA